MTAAAQAIAAADEELRNAGLMTYSEMAELLQAAAALGLSFDIGRATILRSYITTQDELRAKINPALAAIKAAAIAKATT